MDGFDFLCLLFQRPFFPACCFLILTRIADDPLIDLNCKVIPHFLCGLMSGHLNVIYYIFEMNVFALIG